MSHDIESPAFNVIAGAQHPSPEQGGPCATCAFRPGTEANCSEHTVALAKLCVEGGREFHCHEKTQLCRGFIAAINLRGLPFDDVAGKCADILGDEIKKRAKAQAAPPAKGDGAK